tara:strand:- start:40 stop:765 length:726 start_codon:yes stop_codon:yes gene_type:complete
MDIEQLNREGYSYCDISVEEEIIDKIVSIIKERHQTGEGLKKKNENFTMLSQPFLIEECIKLALSDDFLAVPYMYFEGRPFYLGTCNLRRSVATHIPETTTTLFHRDKNLGGYKQTNGNFLKMFVYLSDVKEENGPFTYIRESANLVKEDTRFHRQTDEDIAVLYPGAEIKLVGPKGQVLTAVTTGLHKGTKVKEGYRDMFTINYCAIPEESSVNFKIKREVLDSLPEGKKEICKYLTIEE